MIGFSMAKNLMLRCRSTPFEEIRMGGESLLAARVIGEKDKWPLFRCVNGKDPSKIGSDRHCGCKY